MSDHPLSNLSADALREAADIRDQIQDLQAKLDALLSGGSAPAPAAPAKRRGRPPGRPKAKASKKKAAKRKGGKRKISPEGLERIRAAQRKRWANQKKK